MEHCLVIWAILAIKLVLGSTPDISKETLNHVPHHPIKEPHFDEEGGHNTEFDHDAVIGKDPSCRQLILLHALISFRSTIFYMSS